MRTVMAFLILASIGCAKGKQDEPQTCAPYTSAYLVEWPDASLRKSEVELCGSTLKVTDLDLTREVFEAPGLRVQLKDPDTGVAYLTVFEGQ